MTGTSRPPPCVPGDARPAEVGPVKDDRLRLIFTCCHPALAAERPGRPHPATARRAADRRDRPRLPRARGDDGAAPGAGEEARSAPPTSPTVSPATPSCPTGSRPVLAVVYLVFNEGYAATTRRRRWSATDLCAEAIRLARLLVELMPDEPEALGLLALLLLTESRRPPASAPTARSSCSPTRTAAAWDRALIAEGQELVRALPAAQHARSVPDPGGDQRRAQRRADGRGHRLASDRRPLRPAARRRADAGRRPQPRRGRRRGRRSGRRPRRRRRARRRRSAATTCSTPPGPTCCAASVAATRPPAPTPTAIELAGQRRRAPLPGARRP